MAEVFRSFDEQVVGTNGVAYITRVVGQLADDGMWEGWLEFLPPRASGAPLATRIETRQPERAHLAYWASGLSAVYVEGALHRAKEPITVTVTVDESPVATAPAPRVRHASLPSSTPEAVLDPFAVGSRNLDILRQELTALNRPRLLNIISAYDLNPPAEDLTWMTDAQLVTFITTAVETRLLQARDRDA